MKTFKEHVTSLEEEVPTNAASTGSVAGVTGEPPVAKKKRSVVLKRTPLNPAVS